jgi:arylsulfatase A-like enzyme
MAAATIGLLGVLYVLRRALSGLARPIVAAAGALFFIQATSCAWAYSRLPSNARLNNGPTLSEVPGVESKPHILWIIFDELDYELATDLRPASVRMPNFDRLREESLWASAAHSPANWTSIALPALVSGKRLSWVRPEGPSELYIWDAAKKPVLWQNQPTIFSYARQKGLNSAVVGWYHPYCRIFHSDLAGCFWAPSADATDTIREQFVFGQHVRPIWPANRGVSPAGEYEIVAREHEKEYRDTLRHARSILTDKKMNLIVLHWPVPHPPAIYDRNLDRIVTRPGLNYLDNLELVDFTLGEIRHTLEREGMWDKFVIVVTGDHPLRPNVWENRPTWTPEEATLTARRKQPRVPLLIKLPQVNRPSVYDSPVDTVLIHDLTKRWIEGQDLTPDAVTAFLNENRGRFPVDLARKSPDAPTAERLPD